MLSTDPVAARIYSISLRPMKLFHILFWLSMTFLWIWSLPLLVIGFLLSIPAAIVALPLCVLISITLQYYSHNTIMVDNVLRQWISTIPWHQWFPCNTLTITDPSVIAVHPHGVLCCGALAGIHLIPNALTVFCVAPVLFYVPIFGWCLRALGCIEARREIMLLALQKGYSIIVVPGGVPELVLSETGDDTQMFQRTGFLKVAQRAGVPVQMIYVQGECATFWRIRGPCLSVRVWLSWRMNVPLTLPIFGGWWGLWIPKRVPLQLLMTKYIRTQKYYLQLEQLCQQ